MEAYSDFAKVYDIFMDEVPYDKWCEFLVSVFNKYNVPKELVLDLGCGTGVLTRMLAARGYSMIGVDNSPEMLNIARLQEENLSDIDEELAETIYPEEIGPKALCEDAIIEDFESDESLRGASEINAEIVLNGEFETDGEFTEDEHPEKILYLMQDMREFELYGTVRAVISVCDSINYLLEDEDVLDCFRLVNNYLDPDGIFVFDFNTPYKYGEIIGDSIIAENREDCSFIWENFYDEESKINEYDLTIFLKTDNDLYGKSVETHLQRGYTLAEMKSFVEKAGLELMESLDADTLGEVTDESERIYIVAKERGKNV